MSKYIKAQELNRRITIQQNVGAVDDRGFQLEDWEDYMQVWTGALMASGASMIGQEFQAGGLDVSRIAGSFRIRKPYQKMPTAGMRILREIANSPIYDIRAVVPDLQDNRFLFLAVSEGANRG